VFTLAERGLYQAEIKKSRFTVRAQPISSVDAAMDFFAAESDPLATHNCWAYRYGQSYRFNDDGEPSGTAGKPILQAIDGSRCDRVAVLVVRWFGGIKLGPGGLMRAYGASAAQCLRNTPQVEIIEMIDASCECSFHDLARIRQRLEGAGGRVRSERFKPDGVALELSVPKAQERAVHQAISDASRGQAVWTAHEPPRRGST
jgi:uncharacterized YigZ family protein